MADEHGGSGGVNQAQYEQARLAGMYARQAGRKRETCPRYGQTQEAALLREAWQRGWDEENERRAK